MSRKSLKMNNMFYNVQISTLISLERTAFRQYKVVAEADVNGSHSTNNTHWTPFRCGKETESNQLQLECNLN
jgi:hypothetical protein